MRNATKYSSPAAPAPSSHAKTIWRTRPRRREMSTPPATIAAAIPIRRYREWRGATVIGGTLLASWAVFSLQSSARVAPSPHEGLATFWLKTED